MSDCPSEEAITRIATNPDEVPTEILEHLAICPSCRRKLDLTDGPVDFSRLRAVDGDGNGAGDEPNPWFLDRMKAAVRYTVTGRPGRDPGPQLPGYSIEAEIARGGMGIVYRARDVQLGRTVAVKMLPPEAAPDSDRLTRFLTEAKALAALQHPNVVQLFQAGDSDGRPYLVMEYISGGTLRQSLRSGPWTPAAAASLLRTLADATEAAHRLGIVHRDLKPGNVLLSTANSSTSRIDIGSSATSQPTGSIPKIADFGLARFLDSDQRLTSTGEVIGTPEYMSPEQATGRADLIGPATDLWALGVTMYEVLIGRPPFSGLTRQHTLEQITRAEPVPPTRLRPGLPPELCAISLKCLEKDPRNRYASAAELRDDLDRFLAGKPVLARPRFLVLRWLDHAFRHPGRSIAWGIGGFLAAAVFLVSLWGWFLAREQLADAATEATRTQTAYAAVIDDLYAARIALADRAVRDGRDADAEAWLAACKPTPTAPADLRGWDWFYLRNSLRAHAPARVMLQKHEVSSRGFDFPTPNPDAEAINPDRSRRVAVGPDGRLTVHDDDGRMLLHLPVPGHTKVVGLHFSKDGRWLAARTATDELLVYDGGN